MPATRFFNLPKEFLRAFLLKTLSVGHFLALMRWRGRSIDPGRVFVNQDHFLTILGNQKKTVFFIQIGANDGVTHDPLHRVIKKHHWRGILVEPLPSHFEKLEKNYSEEPQLILENVAIAEQNSKLVFHYLPPQYNNPSWLQQIGTFDRQAIESNLKASPELIPHIETCYINAISLKNLTDKWNVSRVDLLVVDAEGYEDKIIPQIKNLPSLPDYILFEWGCLERPILDGLVSSLEQRGYEVFSCGGDLLAARGAAN